MVNEIEVGAIFEGKVTGITKFGAFVALPGGKSGLVHISEIAYSYVSEVADHLAEGQDVKVKVISIDENHRINLSIKRALPPPPRPAGRPGEFQRGPAGRPGDPQRAGGNRIQGDRPPRPHQSGEPQRDRVQQPRTPRAPQPPAAKEPKNFDDMLKQFMSDSDSKLSGHYAAEKGRRRNNNGGNRRN